MDGFFGIGIFELVMIAIVALIVLGPDRLPGAMREVAKYMRQLRQISGEFQSQFSEELQMLDELNPKRIIDDAIDPKPKKPAATAASATKMSQPRLKAPPKPPVENLEQPAVTSESSGDGTSAGDAESGTNMVSPEPANSILPPAKASTPAVDQTPSSRNGEDDVAASTAEPTASSPEEPR